MLFDQNVIALIWDFDRTLSPHYMQRPLFEAYGIDERAFWAEVNALPAYYAKAGIHVQSDTCYLGHLLSYVRHGRIPDLTNARLKELGKQIDFFPGIPEMFGNLKMSVESGEFGNAGLHLEHYVVSTGLAAMIRGSHIASELDGIWASEFIEEPAPPGYDRNGMPHSGIISQIAGLLDNTTKTRAIFEINKGVNVEKGITVNASIAEGDRRVPMKNMIYIADGPSDIPSFSVVRKHGGLAYAVYDPNNRDQFEQVVTLQEKDRVNSYGPADYRESSQTFQWLTLQVRRMAQCMIEERRHALETRVGKEPTHIGSPE